MTVLLAHTLLAVVLGLGLELAPVQHNR